MVKLLYAGMEICGKMQYRRKHLAQQHMAHQDPLAVHCHWHADLVKRRRETRHGVPQCSTDPNAVQRRLQWMLRRQCLQQLLCLWQLRMASLQYQHNIQYLKPRHWHCKMASNLNMMMTIIANAIIFSCYFSLANSNTLVRKGIWDIYSQSYLDKMQNASTIKTTLCMIKYDPCLQLGLV